MKRGDVSPRGISLEFEPGDVVDMRRWDVTVRDHEKYGVTKVLGVRCSSSQTGWIINVADLSGGSSWLDQDWGRRILV
jgi:hypothetical protein